MGIYTDQYNKLIYEKLNTERIVEILSTSYIKAQTSNKVFSNFLKNHVTWRNLLQTGINYLSDKQTPWNQASKDQ